MATRLAPKAKRPKTKRSTPEEDFQILAVEYLRLVLPEPCRAWFVPNRNVPGLPEWLGARFKRMGLLAGVHDLHVMVPGGFYTLECKAGRNKLTAEQSDFGAAVEACGHCWFEVRTLDDVAVAVAHMVRRHGIKLRPVHVGPGGVLWDRGTR